MADYDVDGSPGAPVKLVAKPKLVVRGMLGVGDNLHQRAVVRELMKKYEVWLQTFYVSMYHDLTANGLKLLSFRRPRGRIRDDAPADAPAPRGATNKEITYRRESIHRCGSILAAMFDSVDLPFPAAPDFTYPVPASGLRKARALIDSCNTGGLPLMIYRPIVQNHVWPCPSRSPDSVAYAELYESIRESFFTVSVADLTRNEWIVGAEQPANIKLHHGEVDFETLAGLFSEASLVFANPGFAPVLAQAVGAPTIIVYGGNESHRTTNVVGEHQAKTLAIQCSPQCECHQRFHACGKWIDVQLALPKVKEFSDSVLRPIRVLIFGTVYCDTLEKAALARVWAAHHKRSNPNCDLLLVDSNSPLSSWLGGCDVFSFPDNIGHLAKGGKDGWGRAFCKGLELARERGYDYVAHIEGDSLLRFPVMPIVRHMQQQNINALSVPVDGTKNKEKNWVETGLMFFSTKFINSSDFVNRYDWPNRASRPTPEAVIYSLLGADLKLMPWKAERGDRGQITAKNSDGYDWITHCDRDAIDAFINGVERGNVVKINLGCGTNKLAGWQNYDYDVDITKRLPFEDSSADFILAEHVVEHVDYNQALRFFRECGRVLKSGGVLRITVPSIENVWKRADPEYCSFASKWAPDASVRGAMHAMLYSHGHRAPWTQSLLEASLYFSGFGGVAACEPGKSSRPELHGVEGHQTVIGERFNWIESISVEGTAEKVSYEGFTFGARPLPPPRQLPLRSRVGGNRGSAHAGARS